MRKALSSLVFAWVLGWSGAASAGYLEGVLAYQAGDYATAVRELHQSAEQGDANAQFGIGSMYYKGKGVTQDYATALNWYLMAAQQGNANAQYSLGYMYNKGEGVTQDFINAHMWFNIAAASGGMMAEASARERNLIAEEMTPTQIAEAQKMAREWMQKHQAK